MSPTKWGFPKIWHAYINMRVHYSIRNFVRRSHALENLHPTLRKSSTVQKPKRGWWTMLRLVVIRAALDKNVQDHTSKWWGDRWLETGRPWGSKWWKNGERWNVPWCPNVVPAARMSSHFGSQWDARPICVNLVKNQPGVSRCIIFNQIAPKFMLSFVKSEKIINVSCVRAIRVIWRRLENSDYLLLRKTWVILKKYGFLHDLLFLVVKVKRRHYLISWTRSVGPKTPRGLWFLFFFFWLLGNCCWDVWLHG